MLTHLVNWMVSRIPILFGNYSVPATVEKISAADKKEECRIAFWRKEGESLDYLLARAAYSDDLRRQYVAFYNNNLSPLLGPSPSEFSAFAPSSFVSDDHTPFEFIWAIGRQGNMSVRFAFEPLSSLDGSPYTPSRSMASLDIFKEMPGLDLAWSNICGHALLFEPSVPAKEKDLNHSSQFIIGGDLETGERTVVGKVYFLPHIRAAYDGVPDYSLVKACMSKLGVGDSWEIAACYLQSIAEPVRPTVTMVAVDCLEPSQNRAKVYVRTQSSSFNDIAELLTLGGRISDEYVAQTVSAMHHLWRLFFPGVADETPLTSKRDAKYFPTGFLIYYEMALDRAIPVPKVYIPVRHYCEHDAHIAAALSQYFKDVGLTQIGEQYKADLETMFGHRSLEARTGIHVYVGLCTKKGKGGPMIYNYLSPEVFAPERQH